MKFNLEKNRHGMFTFGPNGLFQIVHRWSVCPLGVVNRLWLCAPFFLSLRLSALLTHMWTGSFLIDTISPHLKCCLGIGIYLCIPHFESRTFSSHFQNFLCKSCSRVPALNPADLLSFSIQLIRRLQSTPLKKLKPIACWKEGEQRDSFHSVWCKIVIQMVSPLHNLFFHGFALKTSNQRILLQDQSELWSWATTDWLQHSERYVIVQDKHTFLGYTHQKQVIKMNQPVMLFVT